MAWAVNSQGDWYMLDASVKKMTIAEQYEPIYRMVRTWGGRYGKSVTVGVEIDGQQQLNLHSLKKGMVEHSTFFQFARQIGSPFGKEGISRRQATGAKHEQFMRVHPLFQQHKIYFPEELKDTPDMKEILDELSYITYEGIGSKHDDCGTYDTVVDTPTGPKKLGEISNGDEVIGFGPTGSAISKVQDVRMTGIKPIVNIETSGGEILRFSEFHPILTQGGSYKLVRELQVGDKLLRNTEWKKQLNMMGSNGHESLLDTTNPPSESPTALEKTGYINTYMNHIMNQCQKVTTYITKTMIKATIVWTTSRSSTELVTNLCTPNRISTMVSNLQTMLKLTSMKFKHWLKPEKTGHIWEKVNEKNYQTPRSSVLDAVTSSCHIKSLEKMLNTVLQNAETPSVEHVMRNDAASSVETYTKQHIQTLLSATNVQLREEGNLLIEKLKKYVKSAEVHSQVLHDSITAEKNAQELLAIETNVNAETVTRIWVSSPEPTYNFEVERYHNYQVHDGYVVHNCLDGISMIAAMEVIYPSEDQMIEAVQEQHGNMYYGDEYEGDDDDLSTIF